jgi:hypothetical protein
MTDEAAKQTPTVDATELLADDYRVGPRSASNGDEMEKRKPFTESQGATAE